MTKKSGPLPGTMQKRELLYGKGAPAEQLRELGERYMDAGQPDEAAHFFHRAGASDRLAALADAALSEGDLFTFTQARKLLGRPIEPRELRELAAHAQRGGREIFARKAEAAALAQEEERRLAK